MSLRLKLTSILAAIVVVFAALDWAVLRGVVYPSFVDLEENQARQDLNRVFEALQNEVGHLDGLVHDWASRDDSYQFVVDQNDAYARGNLTQTALENNELCLISFVRTDGSVAWQVLRPEGRALREFPGERRPPQDPLASALSGDEPVSGFLATSQGILFFAARPILKSSQEGPSRGRLLMARLLDEERLGALARRVRVPFGLGPLEAEDESEGGEGAALQRLAQGEDCALHERSQDELDAYGWLRDFRGQPIALVQAEVRRDVTACGREALDDALAITLLAALLVLGALYFLLQRLVVAPLQRLGAQAEKIGRDGDLERRAAA